MMVLQVRHILYRKDTGGMNFLMHSAAAFLKRSVAAFEATQAGTVPPVVLHYFLLQSPGNLRGARLVEPH